MVALLLLILLGLTALTGALEVPCSSVPENGAVTISSEGVHTFRCLNTDIHELVGRQTANCLSTGYLDIASLPKCVVKQPLTTHIKSTHRNVRCTKEEVNRRFELLMRYLTLAECMKSKTCTFKEMNYDCPLDKVTIDVVFIVSDSVAEADISTWAKDLTKHSRRRRDLNFDDFDTEDTASSKCAAGQGVSSDGNNCIDCPEGMYGDGAETPQCKECALGKYQPSAKQTECLACTDGKSTLLTGSTSADDCKDLCTLPATSVNSQFTVNGVAKADASTVAVGTSFTMLCDQDYTFKNANKFTQSCTQGLATSDIKNECFKVTVTPDSAVYKFIGETASITCVGAATVDPHLINVRTPLPTGLSVEKVEGTGTYDADNDVEKPAFDVTNPATPGRFALSCDMQVYSSITDKEQSVDSADVVFFKSIDPPATADGEVDKSFSVDVQVFKDDSSTYSFSWTKNGNTYSTFSNSDATVDEVAYKKSTVSITKLTLADKGTYACTVSITDLEGNKKLTKSFTTVLSMKGFSVQPQDSSGVKAITQPVGAELTLTCAFEGTIDASETFTWTKEGSTDSASDEAYMSITDETKDGSLYKYLKISAWPSSWNDDKFVCQVFKTADKTVLFTSDSVSLTSSSYVVTMDANSKCTSVGTDAKFSCTASFPDSITTGPTVTWHKVSDSGDQLVEQLLDSDSYVVVGAKDGTSFKSTLTIDNPSSSAVGSYYCVATYTEPSYLQISKKADAKSLTVVELKSIAKKTALMGATNVVFSTTFSGQKPLAAKWTDKDGKDLSTETEAYTVVTNVGAASGPYTLSLTIKTVSADTPDSFKVVVTMSPGTGNCDQLFTSNEYTQTAELVKLSAAISTDAKQFQTGNDYAFAGGDVKFTCTYTNPADTTAPTVTWTATATKAGVGAIATGTPDNSAAASSPEGKVVITLSNVKVDEHSGTFGCSAVYPDSIGTATSTTRILHVLGFKPITTTYVGEGGNTKLKCTFTGRTGVVAWKMTGNPKELDEQTQTGTYTDGEITSELSFTNAQHATDEGQYSCTMTYADIAETKELQPWLKIMRVTEVSATPVYNDVAAKFDLTCKVSWNVADLSYTPTVSWKLTDKDNTAKSLPLQSDHYKYSVATATAADMGEYECKVDFNGVEDTGTTTVYVRSAPVFSMAATPAASFHAPSTVLVGLEALTLSCVFSGDPIGDVSWYKGNTILTDTALYILPAAVASTYGATSTATIRKVADETYEGDYKCKAAYSADSKDTESNSLTLAVLGATSVASSKQYANKGDQVVLACNYLELTGDNEPAAWTVQGVATATSSSDSSTKSEYTLASADVANNGVATCAVTYSNGLANSETVVQYVRDTGFANLIGGKLYGMKGQGAVLTCVVHGDKLKEDIAWTPTGTTETKAYTSESTESTFTIASVTEADGKDYTCSGRYLQDNAVATATQTLTVLKATVTGTTPVNKGGETTLTCNPVEAAQSYSWKKGGAAVLGATAATLTLSTVDFSAAADYKCVVVYQHSLGTLESEPYPVFVQGFVSLVQINKAGAYNEIGETVTLKATIRAPATPGTFKLTRGAGADAVTISNTPTPSKNTDQDWEVNLEFAATEVVGENKAVEYKLVVENTGSIEAAITLEIYAKCKISAVPDITSLDGADLDHKAVLSDLTCTGGKTLLGSNGVSCDNGVLTWSAPQGKIPECIDLAIATDPVDQLVEVGKETTMSCVSIVTPVTVTKVEWFSGGTTVYTDNSPTPVQESGGSRNTYTSNYKITGATELNKVSYKCRMTTDQLKTVESAKSGTVYIVGIKSESLAAHYPGTYFESDGSGVATYSESASIKFEGYVGPGIASVSGSLAKTDGSATVTFTGGTEANNLIPYEYNIDEVNKKTGTYTVTVTYSKPAGANGAATYTDTVFLPVYQFCKVSELGTVTNGTWSPATVVEHRGYATLTCNEFELERDKLYMKGDGVVLCEMGAEKSQFETPNPAPTCALRSELGGQCGPLTEPQNGDVVYKDQNTAYFTCDAGYTLIGAQAEYTCSSQTKAWSIKTSGNPDGDPPKCQESKVANTREVVVTDMKISVTAALCGDGAGVTLVSNTMKAWLQGQNIVECIKYNYCDWNAFTCTYADSQITVGFKLTQKTALQDKTMLKEDENRIKTQTVTKAFEVNTSKKRSTVTATVASVVADTVTTCPSGSLEISDSCSTCPAGWGLSGSSCAICDIGHYSTGNTIVACSACAGGMTTYAQGSISDSKCVAAESVCTVAAANNAAAALVPPAGSRVKLNDPIEVSCTTGYALADGMEHTFKCGTQHPTCFETCALTEFSTDELKSKHIDPDAITKTELRQNEKIYLACMTGYELSEDEPARSYQCSNGALPTFQACKEQSGSQVLTTVIVCVVVLGVAVILLFLFIIVQWRKKKNAASYKMRSEKQFQDPIENMAAAEEGTGVQMKKVSLKLSEADKKAPLMSRPVHISDFSKYYDLLTRNEDRELQQEFATFDSFDDNNTCYHGSIPENDSKNRYKNIIPFDHSRVKLSIINDDVHSDYINASYIHGYHKPRVFIATQAPLYETLDDFWRMIWEKKSTMVVNLTKVEENGKIKSVVYWPSVEEREKQFGLINIKRLDKQESEYFVVYTFEIRHKLEEGVREVFMFNYVGWPDFDVPSRTTEFVNFIYNIRHLLFIRPPMGPIVCHCSAGTGRTGAYIGIMNSLDRLINKEDLDILGLVGSLRQQRRKMVFTNTQYKFLHRVMMDIVTNDNFDLLKQSGFRKKIEVQGVVENPYVSTSESDELDELNDTKV